MSPVSNFLLVRKLLRFAQISSLLSLVPASVLLSSPASEARRLDANFIPVPLLCSVTDTICPALTSAVDLFLAKGNILDVLDLL